MGRSINPIAVERTSSREVTWPETPQLLRWGDTINRVAVQRTERRIGLRLFGRWFGYESSTTERQTETIQLTQAGRVTTAALPAPRGQVALAGSAVIAIALLGGAIGALLVPTAPRAAERGPLLATLPDSRPIPLPSSHGLGRKLPVATKPSAPAALAQAAPAMAGPSGTMIVEAQPDVPADNSLTLAQARASAISSGEPAYWAESGRSGVVVAGLEHTDGTQMCRLVAVFTRINGDRGSSQSTTQCRGGK